MPPGSSTAFLRVISRSLWSSLVFCRHVPHNRYHADHTWVPSACSQSSRKNGSPGMSNWHKANSSKLLSGTGGAASGCCTSRHCPGRPQRLVSVARTLTCEVPRRCLLCRVAPAQAALGRVPGRWRHGPTVPLVGGRCETEGETHSAVTLPLRSVEAQCAGLEG